MGKINLRGEGEATAEPDIANVTFSVRSQGERPSISISNNAVIMNKLLAVATGQNIPKKDTKTTGFANNPIYEVLPKPKAGETPKIARITHYEAFNEITVVLRDLTKLGQFLTELAAAGATSLSTQLDIGDKSALQKQAREAAFKDAKSKAEQYAELAGIGLGKLSELSESHSWGAPGAVYGKQAVTMSAGFESVPMEGGEQIVTVNVNACFDIE